MAGAPNPSPKGSPTWKSSGLKRQFGTCGGKASRGRSQIFSERGRRWSDWSCCTRRSYTGLESAERIWTFCCVVTHLLHAGYGRCAYLESHPPAGRTRKHNETYFQQHARQRMTIKAVGIMPTQTNGARLERGFQSKIETQTEISSFEELELHFYLLYQGCQTKPSKYRRSIVLAHHNI